MTTLSPAQSAEGTQSLVVDGVTMEFDGKPVLREVNMAFDPGGIHALIGHNGSGKSTLVKILAGYYRPVAGRCWLAGEELPAGSPAAARALGLRFVHQDLGLVSQFTPQENFGIGGEFPRTRRGTIDWKEQARRLRDVFELLESPVPSDRPVSELTAVERALISIARAIGARPEESGTKFVILDEPTATLEAEDAGRLFAVMRRLEKAGIGAIFISHLLNDVLERCVDATVLRDGEVVGTFSTADATRSMLVEAMLGEDTAQAEGHLEARRATAARTVRSDLPPALAVRGLRSASLRGVDITLGRGECVCLVGLAGSGREDVVYNLCGTSPAERDGLEINGQPVTDISPAVARELGVALVPGNRLPGSMVNDFTMRENLSFASLGSVAGRGGRIDRRRERAAATKWVERFDIRPRDIEYRSRYLSGGNKQKMIMAKWLSIRPTTMLIDEPTAGVDVGAVMTLLETLRGFVDNGGALLVSTSELEDALALADRVVVFYEGHITSELVRGRDELSEQSLLLAMVEGRRTRVSAPTDAVRGEA